MLRSRVSILLILTFLGFVLVVAKLYKIQIIDKDLFTKRAEAITRGRIRFEKERGTITDRRGRHLAVSLRVKSLAANPRKFPDLESKQIAANRLAPILNQDASEILRKLNRPKEFSWLARKMSDTQTKAVSALKIKGLFFKDEFKRHYPHATLASHILGFVGAEDRGLDGIEHMFDEQLRGPEIQGTFAHDAFNNPIPINGEIIYPEFDGYTVELTIDLQIQAILEAGLKHQVDAYGAKNGSAVIIDPPTGEILAIANYPAYDPNHFGDYTEDSRANLSVRGIFEPGSAFKVFSGALALDAGLVKAHHAFYCPGYITLYGHRIGCHKTHNKMDYRRSIEVSCNVAAITVAKKLDPNKFFEGLQDFGFGSKTGVQLPGEEKGLMRKPSTWSGLSAPMIGIGQEVSVTPIQLAMATAALANGGRLMKPRIVRSIRKPNGETVRNYHPEVKKQTVSAATATLMGSIMEGVVRRGTGRQAKIPVFPVAGKTGTAQVAMPGIGYVADKYNAVFIGWTPLEAPVMAMSIVIREPDPKKGHYGGTVAAPLFSWVGTDALSYMRMFSSANEERQRSRRKSQSRIRSVGRVKNGMVEVPDLRGLSTREVHDVMLALPLEFRPVKSGVAVSQNPKPKQKVRIHSTLEVTFEPIGGEELFADMATRKK